MSHLFFFYSYSRIFHIYTDILPFSFKSETYLSRMGKLGSVGDKIRNDLHNTIRIALHLQVLFSIIKDEVHTSFYTFLVNSIDCPADFPQIHRTFHIFQRARFYLRQIQYIINKLQQNVRILVDNIRIKFLFFGGIRSRQQLRKPDNRIERCPDFVTHIRQKSTLQPVRLLCFDSGFNQFLFYILEIRGIPRNTDQQRFTVFHRNKRFKRLHNTRFTVSRQIRFLYINPLVGTKQFQVILTELLSFL